MKLPTDIPKNYLIDYDSLEELMGDYTTMSNQMEFIKQYYGTLDYDMGIEIGEFNYTLKITVWKI